jgi:predicted dehydrogenase
MNEKKLKMGLVGLGNMGQTHFEILTELKQIELVGVCDFDKKRADDFAAKAKTTPFYNHIDLFDQSGLEAVMIAVPHYHHPAIAIDAFERGLHVLCEKPLAVHVNEARRTIEAYTAAKQDHPRLVFAMMFQERTLPFYKKIKEILDEGELGRIMRATWINTAWFRSQAYYESGDWRATWAGEGGGILTNQCPHNLDFYQWVFGVPKRISGHAHIGKYHNIEVEDEVTAYFEHENGMVGHFIVTTAESPGTNRLEIVGENGRILFENGRMFQYRNPISVLKHLKETNGSFTNLEPVEEEVLVDQHQPNGHKFVTENFISSVLTGDDNLIAHGTEGIKSITIANGIMLSSFTGSIVDIPYDTNEFERYLQQLIQSSKFVKNKSKVVELDMTQSLTRP